MLITTMMVIGWWILWPFDLQLHASDTFCTLFETLPGGMQAALPQATTTTEPKTMNYDDVLSQLHDCYHPVDPLAIQ